MWNCRRLWTWLQQHLHRAKSSQPWSSGSCSNHSTVPSSVTFNPHHSGCGMTKKVPLVKLWIHSNQEQLRDQACKMSLRCPRQLLIMKHCRRSPQLRLSTHPCYALQVLPRLDTWVNVAFHTWAQTLSIYRLYIVAFLLSIQSDLLL